MERKQRKKTHEFIYMYHANNVSPNPNGNLSILSCVHTFTMIGLNLGRNKGPRDLSRFASFTS